MIVDMVDKVLGNLIWDREYWFDGPDVSDNKYKEGVRAWTSISLLTTAFIAWVTYAFAGDMLQGWKIFFATMCAGAVYTVGQIISTGALSEIRSLTGMAIMAIGWGGVMGVLGFALGTLDVVKVFTLLAVPVLALALLYGETMRGIPRKAELAFAGSIYVIGGLLVMQLSLVAWAGVLIFGPLVYYGLFRSERLPKTKVNTVASASAIYIGFNPVRWVFTFIGVVR